VIGGYTGRGETVIPRRPREGFLPPVGTQDPQKIPPPSTASCAGASSRRQGRVQELRGCAGHRACFRQSALARTRAALATSGVRALAIGEAARSPLSATSSASWVGHHHVGFALDVRSRARAKRKFDLNVISQRQRSWAAYFSCHWRSETGRETTGMCEEPPTIAASYRSKQWRTTWSHRR